MLSVALSATFAAALSATFAAALSLTTTRLQAGGIHGAGFIGSL